MLSQVVISWGLFLAVGILIGLVWGFFRTSEKEMISAICGHAGIEKLQLNRRYRAIDKMVNAHNSYLITPVRTGEGGFLYYWIKLPHDFYWKPGELCEFCVEKSATIGGRTIKYLEPEFR